MDIKGEWIYGRRPVMEVLRAKRRHIYEAVLPSGGRDSPDVAELRSLLLAPGVPLHALQRQELDTLSAGGNHQGVPCAWAAIRTSASNRLCMTSGSSRRRFQQFAWHPIE